jgi:hypothetical protein
MQKTFSCLKDGLLTLLLHALHSIARGILFCVRNKTFIADLSQTVFWLPLTIFLLFCTWNGIQILCRIYPWPWIFFVVLGSLCAYLLAYLLLAYLFIRIVRRRLTPDLLQFIERGFPLVIAVFISPCTWIGLMILSDIYPWIIPIFSGSMLAYMFIEAVN